MTIALTMKMRMSAMAVIIVVIMLPIAETTEPWWSDICKLSSQRFERLTIIDGCGWVKRVGV